MPRWWLLGHLSVEELTDFSLLTLATAGRNPKVETPLAVDDEEQALLTSVPF